MAKITDDQLVAICQSQLDATSTQGELSEQRSDAMDYYLGQPYGDEVEGRSKIVTREVMETVEWVMPSLMRIFADTENLVTFDPVGPEDEEQAEQETDRINYEFWKNNRGFYNLYTFCKDALLSKTGVLKVYWDDDETDERETYSGLDDVELSQLLDDATVEREVLEAEQRPEGWHCVFRTTRKRGRVRLEPCPPEEFGVSREARSPYAQDAQFCFHRTRKTYSDLLAMGYPAKLIDTLPSHDDVDTEERLSRRHLDDEVDYLGYAMHKSMRQYWITECYLRADRNDDGIAELLQVRLVTGAVSSSARLLGVEEADNIPFITAAPILLTHKFFGLSLADITMDLQRIKSTLLRQVLDNLYISNNGRTVMNDAIVNLDDVLTSRPGGVIRYSSDMPWQNYIGAMPSPQIPPETFGMFEYLDEQRKQRTGVGDEVAGLDKAALANVNTGVAALAYDAARSKIELMARIIAEIGLRPLFRLMHEILQKNSDKPQVVRLRNKWVQVNPGEWRTRENLTVNVGVGSVSRERKMMALERVMEIQAQAVGGGGLGTLVMPQHLYRAASDYTEQWGLEPSLYWQDPAQVPPPQPEGPSVQDQLAMTQMQALAIDAQAKRERNQVDLLKVQMDAQRSEREAAIKAQELQLKGEMESLKARLATLKGETDAAGKVASMQAEQERRNVEAALSTMSQRLEHLRHERDREVDVYKIQMDAMTKMSAAQPAQAAGGNGEMGELVVKLQESLEALTERLGTTEAELARARSPKAVKRDAAGRAIAVGDLPIVRDERGLIASIG